MKSTLFIVSFFLNKKKQENVFCLIKKKQKNVAKHNKTLYNVIET